MAKMSEPMPDADPDPKPRRPAISRARIVAAAIEVIDDVGLEGLTMRKLGAALGADPMAAYLHVRNKAELLDAVVESEAARLADVPQLGTEDPVEVIIELGLHYRSILLEHPNLAPVIASRPLPQDRAPESVYWGTQLMQLAGFDPADVPIAVDAMVSFSFGFVLYEAERTKRQDRLGVGFEEQQQGILRQLAESERDTELAEAVVARRLEPGAADEEFIAGMRAMVLGLRSGLHRGPSETDPPRT